MFSRLSRRAFVLAAVSSLCLVAPAFGADDDEPTHESLAKEFVEIVKSATKAIDEIEDEDSAKAAAETFAKLTKQVEKLGKSIKELDEPTDADEKALEKLEEPVKKASDKFAASAGGLKDKLDKSEATPATQQAVGESLQKFGTAMLKYSEVVKEVYGEEESEDAK